MSSNACGYRRLRADVKGSDVPSLRSLLVVEQSRVGFNVPPKTLIGHIGDDFYGSDDPTNSVKHWRTTVGQSHQTKPSYKVKWSKYNLKTKHLYSTIKSENTQVLGGLRARPNEIKARSSRPTWKKFCSLWLCNTNTNNTNTNDNVYGAVIETRSLREFTRFIWCTQTSARRPPTLRPGQPAWNATQY